MLLTLDTSSAFRERKQDYVAELEAKIKECAFQSQPCPQATVHGQRRLPLT